MDERELADLGAAEMRLLIDQGEVTPVEVAEACLERIDRYDDEINAVCSVSDRVLEDAEAVQSRLESGEEPGLLCGLPVGIKDVTETAGLRTTYGSPLYSGFVPDEDALVVSRLREAGAIVLGKTNTPEFATGGNTFNEVFGRTRNPWDPALSAGGSTGGGGAALAAGMIALAQGTDLGGSLRIPASFCGVVGLRPSPGLVPTWPSDYLWDQLQVTGPMARTAEDVALMLQAVAGPSPLSPVMQPAADRDFVEAVRAGPAPDLRVAYCPDVAAIGVDDSVEEVCRQAATELGQVGFSVEEIDLDLSFAWDAFLALRGYWMVAQQYDRLDRLDELGDSLAGNVRAGLATTTEDLGEAERDRRRIWETFRELFREFDHLLTPCMAVPPFPVEQDFPTAIAGEEMETYIDWVAPTFLLSLTGLPVASVPCGLDPRDLPVGMQIVGPPRGEEEVLALARVVQEARPIGRPPLLDSSYPAAR